MTDEQQQALRAEQLLEHVVRLDMRVAVAESLTGGLLADALVSISGASQAFSGAVVAYDTALKHTMLGVDDQLLDECGPVAEEVAKQMARGVRDACAVETSGGQKQRADIGLSTTGVAGPDADPQTGQPPGTVWVGVSSRLGERAERFHFDGDRAQVRAASVAAALDLLRDEVNRL